MRSLKVTLASTVLTVCFSLSAAATGLIDDFQSGTPWVLDAFGIDQTVQAADVLGGAREASIADPFGNDASGIATFDGSSVLLEIRDTVGSKPISFSYCVVMSCGGVMDFIASGYTGFVVSVDLLEGTWVSASAEINGIDQNGDTRDSLGVHEIEIPFGNLEAVAAETVTFTITISTAGDLPTSAKVTRIALVPEPSTASLAGLGLLALGAIGRRRRVGV